MGLHVCTYCVRAGVAPETSSGDTTLRFADGGCYVVPDMLPHYILEHGFTPPAEFVSSVLDSTLAGGGRAQTKGLGDRQGGVTAPLRVGYLTGPLAAPSDHGLAAEQVLALLRGLTRCLREAESAGARSQTRGLH